MNENALNVFGEAPKAMTAQSVTAAMATTRQAQEVQAAMVVAKHFPRVPQESMSRILESCMRPTLAESATYEYSRGGSKINGPSIRLAECIAQNWGNIDFGFLELDRKNGESTVMAYAWDLETNTRRSLIFTVRHVREANGGSYPVTSERDIYEIVANQAQRRVRACILALIPGDVIDNALRQCELTLKTKAQGVPIEKRREDTVAAFAEYNVTPEMLAAFCQKKSVDFLDDVDLRKLRRAYTSLKDGMVGSEYFTERMTALAAQNAEKEKPTAQSEAPAPEPAQESGTGKQTGLDAL